MNIGYEEMLCGWGFGEDGVCGSVGAIIAVGEDFRPEVKIKLHHRELKLHTKKSEIISSLTKAKYNSRFLVCLNSLIV